MDNRLESVEIPGEGIDARPIRERIEADARRLHAQLGDGSDWPSYRTGSTAAPLVADVADFLQPLASVRDGLYVEAVLTRRSRLSRFGPLAAARRALHTLILFYVNTLASRQIVVNNHILDGLRQLSQRSNRHAEDREVVELRQAVRRLEQRVASLEERLPPGQGG